MAEFPADAIHDGLLKSADFVNLQNVKKANLTATVDPAVTDDSSAGYAVGSKWINVAADKGFECMDASVGAAIWKNTTGTGGDPEGGEVSAIAQDSTTSSTDVLMDSMTFTPGEGTYLIWFNGSLEASASNKIITVSVYANGIQNLGSVRNVDVTAGNTEMNTGTLAQVTVAAAQAIEVKWRISSGTAFVNERCVLYLKVAP